MTNKRSNTFKNLRLAQMAISLGINFAIWSFAGYFLGSKIDEKLGSEPWFMIAGILLGIGFTFYGFIKEILVLGKLENRGNQNNNKDDKK